MKVNELRRLYKEKRKEIRKKLVEFRRNLEAPEKRIFYELIFCLLTPQSNAEVCDKVAKELEEKDLIFKLDNPRLKELLERKLKRKGIRFWRRKVENILRAKQIFLKDERLRIKEYLKSFANAFELRDSLVRDVRGIGFKEASHFIRNVGFDYEHQLAILDRHILRSLQELRVIKEVPRSLSKCKYLEIEEAMRKLAKEVGIGMYELDMLLWYLKTGKILR